MVDESTRTRSAHVTASSIQRVSSTKPIKRRHHPAAVGSTRSFAGALRSALRESPDVLCGREARLGRPSISPSPRRRPACCDLHAALEQRRQRRSNRIRRESRRDRDHVGAARSRASWRGVVSPALPSTPRRGGGGGEEGLLQKLRTPSRTESAKTIPSRIDGIPRLPVRTTAAACRTGRLLFMLLNRANHRRRSAQFANRPNLQLLASDSRDPWGMGTPRPANKGAGARTQPVEGGQGPAAKLLPGGLAV